MQGSSMSQTHVLLSQFPGPLMPNTPKDKVSPSVTALWCLLLYAVPIAVLIPILQQMLMPCAACANMLVQHCLHPAPKLDIQTCFDPPPPRTRGGSMVSVSDFVFVVVLIYCSRCVPQHEPI